MTAAIVLVVLCGWPVLAAISTYRRDRRQFRRGVISVAIFLITLVGFVFAIARWGFAGIAY